MDKDLKILVTRLENAFPNFKLIYEGEYFFDEKIRHKSGKMSDIEKISMWEENFVPPREYNWYEFLEKLKENGLTITNIKKSC